MAMSLEKISKSAPSLLKNAEIAVQTIDKAKLNGATAKVVVALDYSGSMRDDYSNGSMQRLTEKVLALGTQFDDDGSIDFFVFDSHAAHLGEVSISDFGGSVARLTKNRPMGLTNYAEAFLKIRDHFGFAPGAAAAPAKKGFFGAFKKQTIQPAQSGPADQPVYVLFLTDGAPNNEKEAAEALTQISTAPIFFKFLSIGRNKIDFLQKLDDLDARFMDNADYQHIGNLDTVPEAELFDKMLVEFPEWIADVRSKGLIK